MTILIIGGLGFVGSYLVRELLKRNEHVIVLDDLSYGSLERAKEFRSDVRIEIDSICNEEKVKKLVKEAASVINLACVHMVDSMTMPHNDALVNIMGTLNCLEACRTYDVKYIHISSGSVHGADPPIPITEDYRYLNKITTPYAVSKTAGDAYSLLYHSSYGVKTAVLRLYFVYGFNGWNVVSKFITQALESRSLTVHGDGSQRRTPTYVEDAARGIILALRKKIWGEAFNIAGNEEISILALARKIKEISKSKSDVVFEPRRPGDIQRVVPSIEKAKSLLGYEPQVTIQDGLKLSIERYRKTL